MTLSALSAWQSFLITYPSIPAAALFVIGAMIRSVCVPGDRQRSERLMMASLLALPSGMVALSITDWLGSFRQQRYDLYLLWIDRFFGEPSFWIGQLAANHPWLMILLAVSYDVLPIALIVIVAAYLWKGSPGECGLVVKTLLLNLFVAIPIYFSLPAEGPLAAYGDFPHFQTSGSPHVFLVSGAAPINCVPSVHFSTALLLVWFARRWRAGLILSSLFLVLTGLATMGSGQHYCIDLIVAIPYAVLICKAASWRPAAVRTRGGIAIRGLSHEPVISASAGTSSC